MVLRRWRVATYCIPGDAAFSLSGGEASGTIAAVIEEEVEEMPGASLLFGVASLVFGIIVMIFPKILNYLVGIYLILVGLIAILSR